MSHSSTPQETAYSAYPNYEAPRRSYSADDLGYHPRKGGGLKNPLIATLALLAGAGLLAGLMIWATPDGHDSNSILPVIKADTRPIKTAPDDPGGMKIPYKDITVFDHIQPSPATAAFAAHDGTVEDLLSAPALSASASLAPPPADDALASVVTDADKTRLSPAPTSSATPPKAKAPFPQPATRSFPPPPIRKATPPVQAEKPKTIYPAGASPDTLAFVRSVLTSADTASAPPASPVLTHYIQLSSVRDIDRANSQWGALQAQYAAQLKSAAYRVQKKDLGAKGVFYRIQAGPFTKADAVKRCSAIKTITPSGCYLVAD